MKVVLRRLSPAPVRAESRREREIASLFDRLFAPTHSFRPLTEGKWHPFTDIYESESHVLVRMELAGIDPDSLNVTQEGRCLLVRGMRVEPPWGDGVGCQQLEISYGAFERVICLPMDFREDRVRAEYGPSGFLHITISKE
jgi:HSP20 family protein